VLEELHVSGLGVIEDGTLVFAPGLNVLTGETGAGKTLIAVALSLALGTKASADLVRAGSGGSSVEARFRLEPRAESELAAEPVDGPGDEPAEVDPAAWIEDGELILARTVREDGRSAGRVGGRIAPISTLAAIGSRVVEIHGQNQAEPLLRPATQLAFLDRYVGPEHAAAVGEHRAAFRMLRSAQARLDALDRASREREREKDLLAYQVREIETADVRPGELASLGEEEARLTNAERLHDLAAGAQHALAAEGAGADAVGEAAARLAAAGAIDQGAAGLASRAAALLADARDLAADVRAYRETAWADPERLQAVEERINALRSLERKYGEGEEGILAYLADASARLNEIGGATEEREALIASIREVEARVEGLRPRISAGRTRATETLADAVTAELRQLGMPGARFVVQLEPLDEAGSDGAETIEFRFAGGPRQPLMPLSRAVSGGELSRTMLACRSVLADLDDVPTLVFDEIDAGVGGMAAAAVGERLAHLAQSRQVLVVTHLAQIAAHADRHFLVTKENGAARIEQLDAEGRYAELARMLSGGVSEISLAHARELMTVGSSRGTDSGATSVARRDLPEEG
jgi:DNA repair protein RecN (Recombination protein N)